MAKIYSISTIRRKVKEYGKRINASNHLLSIHTTSDGFGTPYIEIDKNGYNYVINERGTEYERRQTRDIEKLLYWIFEQIVFIMANEYELENRKPSEDHRRQLFAKEMELMKRLDPKFTQWYKEKLDKILEDYPYNDILL